MIQTYHSCGKLMLCGEYAVLQGATAIALPTKKGQSLSVETLPATDQCILHWQSFDHHGACWFSAEIALPHFYTIESTDHAVSRQLIRFLITAKSINPAFLSEGCSYKVETHLEFGLEDGLGSSSTLTHNIALWANADPYKLHFNAFKGSGFDIAVAQYQAPLLYQLNHHSPTIEVFDWQKPFNDQLFFIHLRNKQNTRDEIENFNTRPRFTIQQIEELTRVSKLLSHTKDYFEFCLLLEIAENEVSTALGRLTIKQILFGDYNGTIKSLGAWGGDYILATGENTENYFKEKGYTQIVAFRDMIKLP